MREVAEAADARIGLARRGVDQRDVTAGPFDDQPKIAGAVEVKSIVVVPSVNCKSIRFYP